MNLLDLIEKMPEKLWRWAQRKLGVTDKNLHDLLCGCGSAMAAPPLRKGAK